MGCVSMSSRYFNDGGITDKRIKRARLAARLELEPVRANFRNYGWDQAVGSSGTIRSVGDVIRARNNGDGAITPAAVESLIEQAVRAGDVSKLRLPGLSEERLPVFAGGLAILAEILDAFDIKQHARRRRRAARRIAVRPRRPLHRRGRSRAQRARDAGALSRRCGAVGAGRSFGARFPAADDGRVAAGRAVRGTGAVVGGAAARDRAGRLAFALSQARRVSARARGHARIPAGRAADPRGRGRRAPAQGATCNRCRT